jgi:hypothetical protein
MPETPRMLDIVEPKHQQMPEASNFVMNAFDFFGNRGRLMSRASSVRVAIRVSDRLKIWSACCRATAAS